METINASTLDPNNLREDVNKIYWAVIRKYQEIEKQYDKDTNHYRDTEQQARWNKRLEELLKSNVGF